MNEHPKFRLLLFLSTIYLTSAVDFLFNGFDSSDVSRYLDATVESHIITLTRGGRAFYPSSIPTKHPDGSSLLLPFTTTFIFAISPHRRNRFRGGGVVFCLVPREGTDCTGTGSYFGVEFDVHQDEYRADINDNHVGINVNSPVSVMAREAGYWVDDHNSFDKLTLSNGKNYQVWIDNVDGVVNVTLAPVGLKRPNKPLLSLPYNLSQVLEDEMYVGFVAASGTFTPAHRILAWSFSNTNFSLSEGLITKGLPSFELLKTPIYKTKGFIAGMTVGVLFSVIVCSIIALLLVTRNKRRRKKREEIEDWELEYWPHRISCQEIESATMKFSEANVIGIGGNGKVYRGAFPGGLAVALKCISRESSEGLKAFSAEISSLGRLKHRNLVGLRGWCKKEKGSLILVYDYMENGTLDKRLFECDENKMLSCEARVS